MSLILNEEDDIIPRIAYSGVINFVFKSLKKNSDNEILARWVFNLMYYIACDIRLIPRLLSADIITIISVTFENHAGNEALAEWGLRTLSKLTQLNGLTSKMRNAGLCELTTSTVQRQAISRVVTGHGCLALGQLATDSANHDRLAAAGASEAIVGALKRHDKDPDVVINSCYALHFLCSSENNISWLGANGACEAVTNALVKHSANNVIITQSVARALGSLAFHDDGNLQRFYAANACVAVVAALKIHAADSLSAQYLSRAIYNLCYDSKNVSELGAKAACGLVVAVLQTHANKGPVVAQACLAIHGLAVKCQNDRVHNGNTRKLVNKGAINVVISVMQKFPTSAEVQEACALAFTSLGRLEPNRITLGLGGACELIIAGMKQHQLNGNVIGKLALAVDILSQNIDTHKIKLAEGNVVEIILETINKCERNPVIISDCFRGIIAMLLYEPSRRLIRSEVSLKQIVKVIKLNEKDINVVKWGLCLIYSIATDDVARNRLGLAKAPEVVTMVLNKHGESNVSVAAW